jgi:ligand-binding sensor domain-containing protein
VEDGLPDNVVNAILQSRDGFLWIGTYAGLARFNGREFMPVGGEFQNRPDFRDFLRF